MHCVQVARAGFWLRRRALFGHVLLASSPPTPLGIPVFVVAARLQGRDARSKRRGPPAGWLPPSSRRVSNCASLGRGRWLSAARAGRWPDFLLLAATGPRALTANRRECCQSAVGQPQASSRGLIGRWRSGHRMASARLARDVGPRHPDRQRCQRSLSRGQDICGRAQHERARGRPTFSSEGRQAGESPHEASAPGKGLAEVFCSVSSCGPATFARRRWPPGSGRRLPLAG